MDKIVLNDMIFYGYHGVLPEEKKLGQRFIVSVELFLELQAAGHSDNVADTVNYADAYLQIKDIVENSRFNLIEALAEAISDKIFQSFSMVNEINVLLKKPEAPIPGIFDFVAVEIRRKRHA